MEGVWRRGLVEGAKNVVSYRGKFSGMMRGSLVEMWLEWSGPIVRGAINFLAAILVIVREV